MTQCFMLTILDRIKYCVFYFYIEANFLQPGISCKKGTCSCKKGTCLSIMKKVSSNEGVIIFFNMDAHALLCLKLTTQTKMLCRYLFILLALKSCISLLKLHAQKSSSLTDHLINIPDNVFEAINITSSKHVTAIYC